MFISGDHAFGNGGAANAVKTITAGNKVAGQFMRCSLIFKMDRRRGPAKRLNTHIVGVEYNLASGGQARRHQILDDFMLSIDDHTFTAGKFAKVDAMPGPAESQLESPMEEPLALQPFTDTCFDQKVDRSLFQNAGADPLFDAFAAGRFQNYRLNSVEM